MHRAAVNGAAYFHMFLSFRPRALGFYGGKVVYLFSRNGHLSWLQFVVGVHLEARVGSDPSMHQGTMQVCVDYKSSIQE